MTTGMNADRTLPGDWYSGTVPANVAIADSAYVETAFSFWLFRGERADAITIGHGASLYLGNMFDVGPQGRVSIGDYALVHGARVVCDAAVTIGDYALVSWNVVLMDTYRVPFDVEARRAAVARVPELRRLDTELAARPTSIRPSATCSGAASIG